MVWPLEREPLETAGGDPPLDGPLVIVVVVVELRPEPDPPMVNGEEDRPELEPAPALCPGELPIDMPEERARLSASLIDPSFVFSVRPLSFVTEPGLARVPGVERVLTTIERPL